MKDFRDCQSCTFFPLFNKKENKMKSVTTLNEGKAYNITNTWLNTYIISSCPPWDTRLPLVSNNTKNNFVPSACPITTN